MSDAVLFRHFPSKEAIVLAVIDRVEEVLFAGFPPEAADPLDRLGQFFRRRADFVRKHPGVARLVGSATGRSGATARGRVARRWLRSERSLDKPLA